MKRMHFHAGSGTGRHTRREDQHRAWPPARAPWRSRLMRAPFRLASATTCALLAIAPVAADAAAITASAGLDFKLSFASTNLAVEKKTESFSQIDRKSPIGNVALTNKPGTWTLASADEKFVYSLDAESASVKITDPQTGPDVGASGIAFGIWGIALTLTNLDSALLNLNFAASWTPKLNIASDVPGSDDFALVGFSGYGIAIRIDDAPPPAVPQGWAHVNKSIALGDAPLVAPGAGKFVVPIAAGGSKTINIGIGVGTMASVVPEPGSALLVVTTLPGVFLGWLAARRRVSVG